MELVVLKQRRVGFEEDVCAAFILRVLCAVALHLAALKGYHAHLAFAEGAHLELRAQGVHRLDTHTVQSDRLLEGLRVVLAAGVQHGDSLDELALRDAAAVVAHGDAEVVLDGYLYAVAGVHLELVDTVVNNLLQQHVDAVFGQRTVAQASDVHAGAGSHMFHVRQVSYVVVVVLNKTLPLPLPVREGSSYSLRFYCIFH